MSANRNPDAVSDSREFHSRVAPAQPLDDKSVKHLAYSTSQGSKKLSQSDRQQHKPGVLASENDRVPEFHAQTAPAGTAPADATYTPNPDLNNQKMFQPASSTMPGADSAALNTGLGHPGQGQTSNELRHDGQHGRKKQALGLAGLTERGNKGGVVNHHDPAFANQRNLENDVPSGQRGTIGGPPAEERFPEGAETVAKENKLDR